MEPFSSCPEIAVEQALAAGPRGVAGRDVWLFTYGAMLEDPPFAPVDQETVACLGWRRIFCLADPRFRGTPENPGLTLGLVEGGQCVGVAWRLAARTARRDLTRVLAAEMKLPFYRAAWAPIHSPRGHTMALALMADTAGGLFEPCLAEARIIQRIAAGSGEAGANADYLRDVAAALDRAGVPDLYLSRLWSTVRHQSRQVAANGPANGR